MKEAAMLENMIKNKLGNVRLSGFFVVLSLCILGLLFASQANAFTINEFAVPAAFGPKGITAGPDGNLWFIGYYSGIGRITPAGAVIIFPNPSSTLYFGQGITAGPDGNIWFTEYTVPDNPPLIGHVGRITPAGVIDKFLVSNGQPRGITAGPDGNLWFVDTFGMIGRITPAGAITMFPVPTTNGPGITAGPDDNIWFTDDSFHNYIGRITTAGLATVFTFNFECLSYEFPEEIVAGPDGNIWFTEWHANRIGRITTDGLISEFMVPTPDSGPRGITAGPDGNIWFTEYYGSKIGRITAAGIITEFTVPTANSGPWGITTGPDGNIWFAEFYGGKIGQVVIAPPKAQMAAIIDFFDSSVSAGTLTGLGPTPTSAKGHLGALRNMLVAASNMIDSGKILDACQQLSDAYQKTDGNPSPPDFVSGPAAAQLASQIQSLMASLGCQ
jgi:streptogramin lyase